MYYEILDLSRLIGAEIHEREFNGDLVDCISIPIRPNGFYYNRGKGDVKMRLICREKRPNIYNYTHYVSIYCRDQEMWNTAEKLGRKTGLLFLGHMISSFGPRKKTPVKKKTSLDDAINRD